MEEKEPARHGRLKSFVASKSSLSFSQMMATSATAVTMALISSQLTSLVNSLLLAGLASIGTALVGEFYRLLMEGAKHGARRIAPVPGGEKPSTAQESEGGELAPAGEGEPSKESSSESAVRPPRNRLTAVLRLPQVQMALVFAVMAVATIFVNYQIAEHNDSAAVVESSRVYHTTDEGPDTVVESEGLTDDEKAAIIEELKKELEADGEAETAAPEPEAPQTEVPTNEPHEPSVTPTEESDSASASELETLLSRIEQLERDKSELETKVEELSESEPEAPADDSTELQKELESLRKRVEELEKQEVAAEPGSAESQSLEAPAAKAEEGEGV